MCQSMLFGVHDPKRAEELARPVLSQESKMNSRYLDLLRPTDRPPSPAAKQQQETHSEKALDVVAIRDANLAATARQLIRAAKTGKTAASMLAEWDRLIPKISSAQADNWAPLLAVIRQGAELQSRRDINGKGSWMVPAILGTLGGAALVWFTLRLMT